MKAEIISVGTELLLGHVINSDAAFVARELASLGIDLTNMQVVGDNEDRLLKALEDAAKRSDIIITTGGLGPTCDDLTKTAVSKFTNLPLQENKDAYIALKQYFGSRQIDSNQFKQALAPANSIIFANEYGTAPGFAVPFGNQQFIILLPGPPSELVPMLENSVRPFLAKMNSGAIVSSILRTFGIGEGAAALALDALMNNSNPTVAPYASDGEMFVKVTAKAKNAKEAEKLLNPVIDEIKSILGDVIYGENVANLEEVVVNKLIQKKLSLATAESCTGGLLAKRITDISGSSEIFRLGLITYSNMAKNQLLNIPLELIDQFGAVSEEVAREMSIKVRLLAKAHFGIGITGIAGPTGATSQKPLGLVYIALAHPNGCQIYKMSNKGRYMGRQWTRMRAASYALDMLRRYLFNLSRHIKE